MGSNRIKCAIIVILFQLACVKARVKGCGPRTQWACKNKQCIDANKHCDGIIDCSDGSDETTEDCSTYLCDVNEFRCAYGACINIKDQCDGKRDCLDNSDEAQDNCQALFSATNQPIAGSCRIIQSLNNGHIAYESNPDQRLYPGNFVAPGSAVQYKCSTNHLLVNRNGLIVGDTSPNYCIDGVWTHQVPECKPFCSTRAIKGITIKASECSVNDRPVSCVEPIRPATVAIIKCADYYHYPNSQTITQQSLTCREDGRWSPEPVACSPTCGLEAPIGTPYIVGGQETNITRVPWHVAIYQQNRDRNGFDIICGGTILNARMVISAMHCFWDRRYNEPYSPTFFRVAAGKTFSDFTAVESSLSFNVKEIIYVKDKYADYSNNYLGDIALLILDPMIEFRSGISPICIPYGLELEDKIVPVGWEGIIAGFGRTSNNGLISERLKSIELPAVERNHCKQETGLPLTSDKFCAGYLNQGISVCEGDSGGGWVHAKVENGRKIHYLRGIVSTGVNKDNSCDNNKYSTFTNILHYDEFISGHEAHNRPTL